MGYFKPLRRKMGLVTLMMTGVLVAGWVRSPFFSEHISVSRNGITNSLLSHNSRLAWLRSTNDRPQAGRFTFDYDFFNETSPAAGDRWFPVYGIKGTREKWKWHWKGCGFEFGQWEILFSLPPPLPVRHFDIWIIPYFSLTIPLILISAWLILSKPRKSNQKNIVEPIPADGT